MAKPLEQNMGTDAMRAATGRTHAEWRVLLAEAGALAWTHPETARYLVDAHGVDAWWAQGITVDFEQACKGRRPGQRADGTFAVARTVTIAGDRLDALARVEAAVTASLGEPHGRNLGASMPVVRWRPADGTRLQAAAQPPNKSGTPINLTWEKLPHEASMSVARERIEHFFEAVQLS